MTPEEMPSEPVMDGNVAEDPMQQMPPMGGDMGGDMPMNPQSEFDSNFDAGVEADEEEDPKRYIQQLTGKLSQSLHKYNDTLPHPDTELSKYVAGMINKQAVKGLSEDDVEDILSKVKSDEPIEEPSDSGNDGEQPLEQPNMQGGGEEPQMQPMPNESFKRRGNKLEEIVNDILHPKTDDEEQPYREADDDDSYLKKPYRSPKFN